MDQILDPRSRNRKSEEEGDRKSEGAYPFWEANFASCLASTNLSASIWMRVSCLTIVSFPVYSNDAVNAFSLDEVAGSFDWDISQLGELHDLKI